MPEFTSAQKDAIYTHGCNILVSAAAGSGKTAVLTERVLTMLCDEKNPINIDRLLVVTFTNAAAAEMKSRIRDKISAQLSNDISTKLRNHLQKQITLMGKAAITTIDSFCIDIVRNNFHLLDINPNFRVANDGEISMLKEQALKETIEEIYNSDKAPFFSDVAGWLGGSDEHIISTIEKCYNFLQSFPNPMAQLDVYEKMYTSAVDNNCEPVWCGYIKNYVEIITDSCIDAIKELKNFIDEYSLEGYSAGADDALSLLLRIKTVCSASWNEFYDIISNLKFPSIGKKRASDDAELCDIVKSKYNDIKNTYGSSSKKGIVQKLYHQSLDEIQKSLSDIQPYVVMFCDAIRMFDEKFGKLKKTAGIAEFSDFEHMAYNILKDEQNGVADSYREKFEEIFVDEYQDCNLLQESMFQLITKKIDGNDCNMFMVGDIKQSIYRFRQADPTIFIEKSNKYSKTDGIQRKIMLNKNFRSNRLILDSINDIFSCIMNNMTGEVDYTDDEKLYFREEDKFDEDPKCEVILIDNKDTLEDIEGADSYEVEARVVANRINSLINEGYLYKDITVLVRSPQNMVGAFENEFKNRLIPYYIDYESGFFDGIEMRLFLSLIKITDNPMQDIPLTGVLRSRLFGFTDDELTQIRIHSNGLFYNAILKCSTTSTELGRKCADFLNRLSVWQDAAVYMPIDEFLIYLANETSLYSYAVLLPGGDQRKANIDFFVQQARNLMKSGFKGLYQFINYFDKIQSKESAGSAKILSQNSNVVRVMSVHKSKGLEFPVVFLVGCDKRFNKKELESNLFCDKELGFGIRFIDPQKRIKHPLISNVAASIEYNRKLISEEMRLLYVAMTRAKTKLICCGRVSDAIGKADAATNNDKLRQQPVHKTLNSSCYFDWILPFVSDKWSVKAATATDFRVSDSVETTKIPDFVQYSDDVKNVLEYEYPYRKSTELATKYSVSELKKRSEFEDVSSAKLYETEARAVPSFAKNETISATHAGTVNHLVLSKIEYTPKSEVEIYNFAKTLSSQGFLTEDELACVNCKGICEFLSSPFVKRISDAKNMYREFPFNMHMDAGELGAAVGEKVLVQGVIDCLFEEEDRVVVVDFKTDKNLSEKSRNQYNKQLEIYSRAAKLITKKEICEKYLYMITQNKLIQF